MAQVLKFKRPRTKHIKGHARECLTDALQSVGKPKAIVIVAIGQDGHFAIRSAYDEEMQPFDIYARAEALAGNEKQRCIEE